MTRTELAEQSLARAKIEDAKDAKLANCALCGSRPVRMVVGDSESMSYGDSVVCCSRCDNEVRIDVYRFTNGRVSYAAAESEAMRRWNIFNKTG